MDKSKTLLPLRLVIPLLSLYVLVSILGLHYHEMALEESQFFLLARDSDSLSDLYRNMQYEGHPRLWCCLLFIISHYTPFGYAGMQALHLVVAAATVFVFLRYAPFGLLSKIGIIGGYYFLFEYDILSRNYAPGILILFICCWLIGQPRRNLYGIGALLLLLCNTHIFFAFVAIGIYAYLLLDKAQQKKIVSLPFFFFTLLFLAGIVTSLLQGRIPAEDRLLPIQWGMGPSAKNITATCYALIRGWLPIPVFSGDNFWNSYWLSDENTGSLVRNILFVFFLLFPVPILKRSVKALVFYYTVIFLLFVFFLFLPISAYRYFGIGYVCFLAACWMAGQQEGDFFSFRHLSGRPILRKFLQASFYGVLFIQLLVGIYALGEDIRRPFSQAKNAITYINEHQLQQQEIVVDGYIAGPALSLYAGRRLYYLNTGRKDSYCVWKRSLFPHPAPTLEEEIVRSAFLRGLGRFILVSNRQMDAGMLLSGDDQFQFTPLCDYRNSITSMENSYIYQATRKTISL
jgi:hypothetical protein